MTAVVTAPPSAAGPFFTFSFIGVIMGGIVAFGAEKAGLEQRLAPHFADEKFWVSATNGVRRR